MHVCCADSIRVCVCDQSMMRVCLYDHGMIRVCVYDESMTRLCVDACCADSIRLGPRPFACTKSYALIEAAPHNPDSHCHHHQQPTGTHSWNSGHSNGSSGSGACACSPMTLLRAIRPNSIDMMLSGRRPTWMDGWVDGMFIGWRPTCGMRNRQVNQPT